VSSAEVLDVLLLEVGVELDLIDGGNDGGATQKGREVLDHEIANADGADSAVGEKRLERAVRLEGPVERARQRLVEDQEIDLLDAELAGALLEPVKRFLVAVVADPDLRLHEDIRAIEA